MATTADKLTFPLKTAWKYVPAHPHQPSWPDPYSGKRGMNFDYAPQPVIAGGVVYFGSTTDNSLHALDLSTGKTKWTFTTGGPVRFAPAIDGGKAYVVSDDGFVYCLDAKTGKEIWKFRGGLNARRVIGNGRMISRWPVRSGIAVEDGVAYFAVGMWSSEGVFVYAVDANTGREVWCNDANISLHSQPHSSAALLGNMPQGYVSIVDDKVGFYNGTAGVFWFNTANGNFSRRGYANPAAKGMSTFAMDATVPGRAAKAADTLVRCENKEIIATSGDAKGKLIWQHALDSEGHGVAISDGYVVVGTGNGTIQCFASKGQGATVGPGVAAKKNPPTAAAESILENIRTDIINKGYALVLGEADAKLAEALASGTELQVICALSDPAMVASERKRLRESTNLYGARLTVDLMEDETQLHYPQLFANVVVVTRKLAKLPGSEIERVLRPCGGMLINQGQITRRGKLPGAYDWDSDVTCDQHLKGSIELLWFGEPGPSMVQTKAGSTPGVANGRMFVIGERRVIAVDAYNGTILWKMEFPAKSVQSVRADDHYVEIGSTTYDAQTGKPATGKKVVSSRRSGAQLFRSSENKEKYLAPRMHPLTGGIMNRSYPKAYGCGGKDMKAFKFSASMDFMRSSTLSYYDYSDDAGMRNFAGIRASCGTKSVMPALGLLLSREGTGDGTGKSCNCAYNYQTTLALAPARTRSNEDWTVYGDDPASFAGPIRHAYVNFAAPGDRRTEPQTLWLAAPRPFLTKEAEYLAIKLPYKAEFYSEIQQYRRNADRLAIANTDKPWIYTSGYQSIKNLRFDLEYQKNGNLQFFSSIAATPPKIDGLLADRCWNGVGEIFRPFYMKSTWLMKGDMQNLIKRYNDNTLKVVPQVAYIRHDDQNLYISYVQNSIVDRRGRTAPIMAETRGKDAPVWQDDSFNVFLTDGAGSAIIHLGVSASGATYDGLAQGPFPTGRKPRGKFVGKSIEDTSWNGEWASAVQVSDGQLVVEIAVPWSTIQSAGIKKDSMMANVGLKGPLVSLWQFLHRGTKLYFSGEAPTPKPYTVRMHFADLENDRPGRRVFDVKLAGKVVLENFDIVAAAGGKNTAVVKEFRGVAASSTIHLEFNSKSSTSDPASQPIISGLEIIAEEPGPLPPRLDNKPGIHNGRFDPSK